EEAPAPMRAATAFLALACVALGAAPGLLFGPLAGLAPWAGPAPARAGLQLPGTGSLPAGGIALVLAGLAAALVLLRGRRSAAPAPTWACGQLVEPALAWSSAGFTKPLRLVLELVLRPEREVAAREAAAEREPRRVRRVPDRPRGHGPRGRPPRTGRVSGTALAAGAVQVGGGVALAPLLPGLVQHWKARLQGRRGPSPVQPFRELRRLFGKSAVTVEGTGPVYRLAPSAAAAAAATAVLLVPPAAAGPDWGVGHDALALAGLLALGRFAVAAAAWD